MAKDNSKKKWKKFGKRFKFLFETGIKMFLFFLLLSLLFLIWKSLKNDQYVIQAFKVPKSFQDSGYDGVVLPRKIQDRVINIKEYISSRKEDNTQLAIGSKPDLNVDVMGIGLSLKSLTFHINTLLGRENKIVDGELTDLDSTLTLTLRMTGFQQSSFTQVYSKNKSQALDILLTDAAKQFIENTDPYRAAVYHYYNKEFNESLRIITKLIQSGEEKEWAYLAWGNLLKYQSKPKESLEKFDSALAANPSFELAIWNKAWTYYRIGEYQKALDCFSRTEALINEGFSDREKSSVFNGIGQCHKAMGDYEKTLSYFEKAIEADPTNIWWYGNTADLLISRMNDTIRGLEVYREASKKAEDGPQKLITMAGYYFYENKQDSAQVCMKKVLDHDPENNIALSSLTRFAFYKEKNYRKAIKYAQRIEGLETKRMNDAFYHKLQCINLMAMSYYHLEKYDSALLKINVAIDISPDEAVLYTTLAETYALMGNHQKFYEAIETAAELGYNLQQILEDKPYQPYLNESRFLALLKQYSPPDRGDTALNNGR